MCTVCTRFEERWDADNVAGSHGAIAQLVERFHGMEEARGSIPRSSTLSEVTSPPSVARSAAWMLGGLVAAEGCFCITRQTPRFVADGAERKRFVFTVTMARRDRALLEQLHARLGVGSLRDIAARSEMWLPTTAFTVSFGQSTPRRGHSLRRQVRAAVRERRQFEAWRDEMNAYWESLPPKHRWGDGRSTCSVPGCNQFVRGRGKTSSKAASPTVVDPASAASGSARSSPVTGM
jgi:hypothetical protein